MSTDDVRVGRTPDPTRGPLLISRKIHLYGKTKKSTHARQTTKPFRTHKQVLAGVEICLPCTYPTPMASCSSEIEILPTLYLT